MKYFFTFIILCYYANDLFSQAKPSVGQEIADHFNNGFSKNYRPDDLAMGKLCREACILIKFKVDNAGTIADLSFTKDSTQMVIIALNRVVDSLQKDLRLMALLKEIYKPVVIPFIYDYQLGCNFPKIGSPDPKDSGENFYETHVKINNKKDHLMETVFEMLNFKDGKLKYIDCLLLSPVRVGATSN